MGNFSGADVSAELVSLTHGLFYRGKVTTYTDSTHFASTDLAGLGNDFGASTSFKDWGICALWDAGGTGASPQGQITPMSEYVSSTGTFTHTAFSGANLAAGDYVLIMHPALAWLTTDGGWTNIGNASVDTLDAAIQALAKVLAIDAANQFSVTMDGSARTTLEAVATALSDIFTASGAAYSASLDGSARTTIASLHTALGVLLGTRDATAAQSFPTTTASAIAYLKGQQIAQGLCYYGDITTYTSTTSIASTTLGGFETGFFIGWTCFLIKDDDGAGAAPQGARSLVTGFTTTTGAITLASALPSAGAVGDQIMLVHPVLLDAWNLRGGPDSVHNVRESQQAELDFARVETIASPVTLTGSIQYIYSNAPGRPFYFAGGFISWDSGAWASAEAVDVNVQVKTDGTNWVDCWNMTQLTAAASPLEVAIPHEAATALLNIPKGFWNDGSGVRVGIVQGTVGAGYHVVSHKFVDGVPGS